MPPVPASSSTLMASGLPQRLPLTEPRGRPVGGMERPPPGTQSRPEEGVRGHSEASKYHRCNGPGFLNRNQKQSVWSTTHCDF